MQTDVDEAKKKVITRISDTGVGIPPKDLPFVFDKFYRAEANNRMAKGTGLGLSLVKHIVETVHHGRMFVESQVGKGSCFGFELDCASECNQSSSERSSHDTTKKRSWSPTTIAHPERGVAEAAQRRLRVLTASDGQEALETGAAGASRPADHRLSHAAAVGLELCQRLQAGSGDRRHPRDHADGPRLSPGAARYRAKRHPADAEQAVQPAASAGDGERSSGMAAQLA